MELYSENVKNEADLNCKLFITKIKPNRVHKLLHVRAENILTKRVEVN